MIGKKYMTAPQAVSDFDFSRVSEVSSGKMIWLILLKGPLNVFGWFFDWPSQWGQAELSCLAVSVCTLIPLFLRLVLKGGGLFGNFLLIALFLILWLLSGLLFLSTIGA